MSAPVVPVWMRLADALSLLLVGIAVWIALTGGARYLVLGAVLSLRSPALFLYAAVAIHIIRLILRPRPGALERLQALDAAITARPAFAAALRPLLATRPMVLLVGVLAVITVGLPPGLQGEPRVSNDPVINLPSRYDALWYGGVAVHGYAWAGTFQRQQNIAFFPALPMMSRALGAAFGAFGAGLSPQARMARVLWAAVAISFAAFLWGLYYFVRLGEDLIGHQRAADAAMLLAAYPFALFYSAAYTESLFLLGAAGACFHFMRRQWLPASAWGLFTGLTRPNGCLLSIPLAILAWQQWRATTGASGAPGQPALAPLATRLLVAATPGIGMLIFTAYLHHLTGIWFAWSKSHAAWGRTFQGFTPFAAAWEQLSQAPLVQVVSNAPAAALNTLGLLFACALLWPTFRRLGAAWGVFVAINLAGPLLAGGVLSLGRLTSTLFPLFLALAIVLPPRAVPACTAAFALLQGLAAALFFTWRDLY